MEANPVVAALEAFTEQGNHLAQQVQVLAEQASQQRAVALNGLRNSFQVIDNPAELGLDFELPQGVTISRLFQGMQGPAQ